MTKFISALMALALMTVFTASAQDSVSKFPCFPGDATNPWWADGAPFGSEQRDAYRVTLSRFKSSWRTEFGVGPIIKTSKTSLGFFNSLPSAQSLSRVVRTNVPFVLSRDTTGNGMPDRAAFQFWSSPGWGVNNDPFLNDVAPWIDLTGRRGVQFGATISEFGTSDAGQSYNGVLACTVNIDPTRPERLYVARVNAANNGCDPTGNLAQFGIGSVDNNGVVTYRADDFSTANACGLNRLTFNNIFRTRIQGRNGKNLNVISDDFPGGLFDPGASDWIVRNQNLTHSTPNTLAVGGGNVLYLGVNFASQFVRGLNFGGVTADTSHLAPGIVDHRGSLALTHHSFSWLGGLATCAVVGRDSVPQNKNANVFSIDGAGNVVNKVAYVLPTSITDNATGFGNLGGQNQFNHYTSQTPFRGGNAQLALGRDQSGRLLIAGEVDHPTLGNTQKANYVAVCRTNGSSTEWTMAGYNDGVNGKPILDGPGGTQVGQMVPLDRVFPQGPFGPSVSAPAFDSVGNVYFMSAIELFQQGESRFTIGLLRAVYKPAAFAYELELLCYNGTTFRSADTGLNVMITGMAIADSNSVDSSTLWSSNVSESAHMGMSPAGLQPRDSRSLGGLVFAARLVYDYDNDGTFQSCEIGGEADQAYWTLLYVGSVRPAPVENPSFQFRGRR